MYLKVCAVTFVLHQTHFLPLSVRIVGKNVNILSPYHKKVRYLRHDSDRDNIRYNS